jgi:hypothetical protein
MPAGRKTKHEPAAGEEKQAQCHGGRKNDRPPQEACNFGPILWFLMGKLFVDVSHSIQYLFIFAHGGEGSALIPRGPVLSAQPEFTG